MLQGRVIRFAAIILVLISVLVCTLLVRSSNRAPDDSYISLRYAKNLADGHGLRFNPGGERVEGFSSPLHVLTMATVIKLGGDPRTVSQFSSLSASLLIVLVVIWWGQRRLGVFWGTAAALAVAVNQGFSFWARSGLDTPGFTLLVLVAMIATVEKRWLAMGFLAGLLAVTRPEGVLYWLPLFAHAALALRGENRPLRELLPALATAVAILATWVLFRVVYFHDLLPNTYYAKMDGMRLTQLQRGLDYLTAFLGLTEIKATVGLAGLGGALYLVRRGLRPGLDWRSWQALGMGLIICAVAFVLVSGGDWMNQNRFFQPVLPVLMLLAGWAGSYLGGYFSSRTASGLATGILVLVFLLKPLLILSHDLRHPLYPLSRPIGLVEPWDDYNIPRLYRLGLKMGQIMRPGETFALCPVGAFAFACDRTVIDMLGLNDREIARLPIKAMGKGQMGHEKGSGQAVLAREPDYLLLRGNPNPEVEEPSPPEPHMGNLLPVIEIWNDAGFHEDYEPFVVKVDKKASFTVYRRIDGGP